MKPLNIKHLENFFSTSVNQPLFINLQDEKNHFFYLYLIQNYCKKTNYDLKIINSLVELDLVTDLFARPKIFIFLKSTNSEITKILSTKEKLIIFTEYKNYKKFHKDYLSMNSYNFKEDLLYLLHHEYKIQNNDLVNFLLQNPEYTYSEISKSSVHIDGFLKLLQENPDDKIATLRKLIYKTKAEAEAKIDIKQLNALIKKESVLKKFNFLTY